MKGSVYKKVVLDNGLFLISQVVPAVHSVSLYVAVGAGPRYETAKTAGLAHFLEHMLFEGTKKFPSSKKLASSIESIGGKSHAYTHKEYVMYYVKVPKQHVERAFSYLAEILFSSTLTTSDIEKEKKIVLEEIHRKKDSPQVEIWDLWLEWVFGKDQTLGRSTLGEEKTVRTLTRSKLKSYLVNLYHPRNMVVAVVGNFSAPQVEQYVQKYFGSKKGKPVPTAQKVTFHPKSTRTKIITSGLNQNHMILGFYTGVSLLHEDRYPMEVLADVLSVGTGSRLFHRLVYDLGISYTAIAGNWLFSDTGLFQIYAGVSTENIESAVKTIAMELDRLKEEKIPEKELNDTKEQGRSQIIFSCETPDNLAYLYASQQIIEKRVMPVEQLLEKIDSVSSEDIQRVAQKYLRAKNLCLIIKGPLSESRSAKIEKLIDKNIS